MSGRLWPVSYSKILILLLYINPLAVFCEGIFYSVRSLEWSVAHATRSRDGRQEGRERGYYHLHRNLNNSLLHSGSKISNLKSEIIKLNA